mmetsp:Transcript_27801/g.40888  ORF Transcript_27801/g.40888 Transcript_27801/m.40888 type:complete len:80 (+) Transcript_27801:148-387(+)
MWTLDRFGGRHGAISPFLGLEFRVHRSTPLPILPVCLAGFKGNLQDSFTQSKHKMKITKFGTKEYSITQSKEEAEHKKY